MTMSITPENEKLLAEAVSSGFFQSQEEALTEAIRLLRQSTAGNSDKKTEGTSEPLTVEAWLKEFDRLTESRSVSVPDVDVSRESIYGDRGL